MAILNNSASLELNEIIAKLLNNKFLSDCVFTFDNEIRVVQAHSFLLRARSIEFEKQFKSSSDNDLKLMPISKHSYESFLEFVRFIYTDQCNITEENVLSILELAVKYRVPKLENVVNEYIIEKGLSSSSKLKLYQFCVIEKYELLQSWISVHIGAQLALILNTESFLEMDPETLEEILKMDYVGTVANPMHELNIFKALMIWISHYSSKNNIPLSERRSKFDRLIRSIRFPVIPIPELNAVLREHDLLLTKLDFESFFTSTNSEVWNFNNRKVYDWKGNDEDNSTNAFSTPLATLGNDFKANDDIILVPPVMTETNKPNARGISNNIHSTSFTFSTGDDSNTRNVPASNPVGLLRKKFAEAKSKSFVGSPPSIAIKPIEDKSKSPFGPTKTTKIESCDLSNYINDSFNTRNNTANWNTSTSIQSTKSGNFKTSTGDDSNTRNVPVSNPVGLLRKKIAEDKSKSFVGSPPSIAIKPIEDKSKSPFGPTKTTKIESCDLLNYINDSFNTRNNTANWNTSTSIQSTKSGNFKTSTGDDLKIRTSSIFGLNPSSTSAFSWPAWPASPTPVGAIDAKAFENGSGKSATPIAFLPCNNPQPTMFIPTELKQEPMKASITTFTPDKDLLIIGLWIKASSTTLTMITVTCNDAEVLKLHVKDRKNDIILSFGESIRIVANMQCKIMIDGELRVLPSMASIPRDVICKDIAECLKDLEVGEKVAEIFFQIPSDN